MSRRIANLGFAAALGFLVTVALSGAAKAGPPNNCGNGNVDTGEQCDDGNTVSGDGCSFPHCLPEVCGDTVVNPDVGEQCDDGNTVSGDGCSATCQSEGPPSKGQQACINGINANGAGVLNAQNKENAKCVKDVAGGKTTADVCLGKDSSGKVGKAGAKTTKTASKKCTGDNVPTTLFTDANTVNTAAAAGANDALTTILGDPATIALKDDKEGSKCQAAVLKALGKLQSTWAKEANKAKKAALKAGSDVPTAVDQAVAASTKIANAENGVNSGIAKSCPDAIVDNLFDCDGATTGNALALCVIAAGKQGACTAMEGADDIDLTCPADML